MIEVTVITPPAITPSRLPVASGLVVPTVERSPIMCICTPPTVVVRLSGRSGPSAGSAQQFPPHGDVLIEVRGGWGQPGPRVGDFLPWGKRSDRGRDQPVEVLCPEGWGVTVASPTKGSPS